MKLHTALLADAAHARDGLLFVIGGGITRVWRPEYPAALTCDLALMVDVHPTEFGKPHELLVRGIDEDGVQFVESRGAIQVMAGANVDVGETMLVPAVMGMQHVALPHPGPYHLEIVIDGQHQQTLRFRADVVEEPPAPSTPS